MARKISRRIYEYTLHAHRPRGNYRVIFETLDLLDDEDRIVETGKKRIFVSKPKKIGEAMMFRVLWVKEDNEFIRFNEENLEEIADRLDRNSKFAVAAHALVRPDSRKLHFEYVRSGPKAEDFIGAVQDIMQESVEGFAAFSLTASPDYAGSFAREIAGLERIKSVRLDLVRPNLDWADEADRLHEFAADSNGGRVSLEIVAPPRESLNKDEGIVPIVTEQVDGKMSHVEKAVVQGQRPGEVGVTTIRSDDHVVFDRADVSVDTSGSTGILEAVRMMTRLAQRYVGRGA